MTFVPTYHFKARNLWADDVFVIPVHYFVVDITGHEITLSHEHSEYQWASYETGCELLRWDGDKTALWELDQRLRHRKLLD